MQVDPDTQAVAPVHPTPPHCAHLAAKAPVADAVADVETVVVTGMVVVVGTAVVVDLTLVDATAVVDPLLVPDPITVLIDPLSTYTPL